MRIFLTLFVCLLAGPAIGQDRAVTLTYQGTLSDAGGQAISGVHAVTFSLYDRAEGGETLWTEVHAETDVVDGMFNSVLGLRSPFDDGVMGAERLYLGIQVDDDVELMPRMRVGGALKAQWAAVAAHAQDVRGEDINRCVTIGGNQVIDREGRWVGDTTAYAPSRSRGEPGARCPRCTRCQWCRRAPWTRWR